jgi:hypothetical protein
MKNIRWNRAAIDQSGGSTWKNAYPIPIIEECLEMCKDAEWFTTIDIKDAYHHVKMAEDSIPLTAFVTEYGLFE